jgi:hypothetical protein
VTRNNLRVDKIENPVTKIGHSKFLDSFYLKWNKHIGEEIEIPPLLIRISKRIWHCSSIDFSFPILLRSSHFRPPFSKRLSNTAPISNNLRVDKIENTVTKIGHYKFLDSFCLKWKTVFSILSTLRLFRVTDKTSKNFYLPILAVVFSISSAICLFPDRYNASKKHW